MKAFVRIFIVIGLLAAGCPQMERRPAETKHARPPTPEELDAATLAAATKYHEGTHALEAIQQVRKAVGEPFRVLEINIHTTSVNVQVQDPKWEGTQPQGSCATQ